jgi:hypothetical protein
MINPKWPPFQGKVLRTSMGKIYFLKFPEKLQT